MKIEHHIYDYNCEIVEKSEGKASIKVKNTFLDYQPADFNVHFAIQTLLACNLLEKLSIGHYSFQKSQYLYDKATRLPEIPYTGKLADDYTFLQTQSDKLGAYTRAPASPPTILEVVETLKPFLSQAETSTITRYLDDIFSLSAFIGSKQSKILKAIHTEIRPTSEIRTIGWKRNNSGAFDYSLPATLFLGTVAFDEKEYQKLMKVVAQIAQKFTITQHTDAANKPIVLVEIEYQNVQPKPKKTKIPPIDFASLIGKEISTSDYFDTLTARGWKYDREESDLFYMLSKTFWAKGIKVCLVFQEHGCIPPDGEENVIEALNFFGFDKKKFKEKNIHTQFKADNYDFDTIEEYIAYFEEQYPYYIPHSDFNTEDYELLAAMDLADVPTAIQKEVWEDLQNV